MGLSENIKSRRMQCNMSQAELAEAICVNQSLVAKFETGERVPNVIVAVAMENVLHTTCAELVNGKEKIT